MHMAGDDIVCMCEYCALWRLLFFLWKGSCSNLVRFVFLQFCLSQKYQKQEAEEQNRKQAEELAQKKAAEEQASTGGFVSNVNVFKTISLELVVKAGVMHTCFVVVPANKTIFVKIFYASFSFNFKIYGTI